MSRPADRRPTRGVGFALLALVIMLIPTSGLSAPPRDRVIVVLEDAAGPPAEVATAVEAASGGRLMAVYEHAISGFAIEVPAAAVPGISRMPGVAWVEPDVTVSIAQTGSQPLPTHLDRIESDLNPPNHPVPVNIAILDTGVQLDHPDLYVRSATDCTGAIFYPLFGGCSGGGNLGDQHGHGTHVAGLAAACDNDIGTIGSAPCAQITSVKVLDASGSGALSGILAGLDIVAANASWIDVANASWGFEGGSQALTDSVNGVVAAGVVFVAAAGNSSQEIATFAPASVPDAITVTAVADFDGKPGGLGAATCRSDVDDTLADFSNFGAGADIAAPGVCLLSSWLNSGYAVASGTSMASPVVAGAAARYIAENGKPTNRAGVLAVRDALVNGGFDQSGTCGFDDVDGIPEPMISVNGSAFGGPGGCETVGGGNQAPTAAFEYVCVDLACTFDASSSTDDGGIESYAWDFGDGASAQGVTSSHTFGAADDYEVALTVTDSEAESDVTTQTVSVSIAPANEPPTADFTFDCPDLRCAFDSSGSSDDGSVVAWSWTFGDGAASTLENPSHQYATSGDYDVTLVVTDDDGVDSLPVTLSVPVVNASPTADFSVACDALVCSFDAAASSDDAGIVRYDWDFGDGGTASGLAVEHTYAAPGDFAVTLTVTDGEGAQGSATHTASPAEAQPLTMTTANAGFHWDPVTRVGTMLLSIVGSDLSFVEGAQVTGYWTWLNRGGNPSTIHVSAVSDGPLGYAEFVTEFKKNQTPIEFCVTDVVADGYVYVPTEPTCAGKYPG